MKKARRIKNHAIGSIFLILAAVLLLAIPGNSQSRAELKKQVAALTTKNNQLDGEIKSTKTEKENLKTQIDRIANIKVDDVITPEEQPNDVVIGESGWRVELNGNKYKSDLIGQLGTVWILDSNNQLQPQGAISLSEYKIDPVIINPDKDILYKKFVSKGTTMQGDGGVPFAKITAGLTADQFSNFTINIEGTSLIKPKLADLKKIATEAADVFAIAGNKGVLVCTGMHVIRYHSRIFSKSQGNAAITSPVINVNGSFFGESNEESSEYLVVRQLTQLIKQSNNDTTQVISKIKTVVEGNQSALATQTEAKKYSPGELLMYFINRQPTAQELAEYQDNPKDFLTKIGKFPVLTGNEKAMFETTNMKIIKVPEKVTSKDPL